MILHLLLTALVSHFTLRGASGFVDLQTSNITETNRTFTATSNDNSTTKPTNVTFSLFAEDKAWLEDELENNQTSAVISEDDERFQEQEEESPGRHCLQFNLEWFSHNVCGETFHQEMEAISPDKWCILNNVIRPYNDLTVCLEYVTGFVGCYYPNPFIQDFFLSIHSTYFHNCSERRGGGGEEFLDDAPHGLIVVLTVVPVGLVPVLVYLVVWKSKV